METPKGFKQYLVKTKWGGIYLIGNSMTKKGINCSLKDEDIEQWVGVDENTLKFVRK
jgi:hypothetical protein